MPTTAELALILRFRDQATQQLRQATQGITQSFKSVGDTLTDLGRNLRQVSRELTGIGLVITGAFTVAFHTAAERVPQVRDAIRDLGHETIAFQESLAKAALPALQQLTQMLSALRQAFDALDPAMRDAIIRFVFIGGVLALISGLVLRVVANIILLLGKLATWIGALSVLQGWILIIGVGIGLLITAMGGWETVTLAVARAVDVLWGSVQLLANLLASGLLRTLAFVVGALEKFTAALSFLPGRLGEFYRGITANLDALRQDMDRMAQGAEQAANQHITKIVDLATKGGGAIETMGKNAWTFIKVFSDALEKGKQLTSDFTASVMDELRKFWADYTDLSKQVVTTLTDGIKTLDSKFTNVFYKIITEGGKAKDAFKAFGQAILETIAMMIAKFLAFATVLLIINAIPGGTAFLKMASAVARLFPFQHGGMVTVAALPHYQSGGEVPIMAHQGEFVVNAAATARNRNLLERINTGQDGSAGGMQVQNVFIIQAIDEASFRGKLQTHADLIEAMFQKAMRRNSGPMREAVKL